MHRLPAGGLLAGLAGLLLGMPGCSSPVAVPVADVAAGARRVARGQAEEGGEKAPARDEKGGTFRLPEDQAGQILGRVLPPEQRSGPLDNPGRAAPALPPPPNFTGVLPPLPTVDTPAPRLPLPRKARARPELVIEEGLEGAISTPALPARPSFVAGPRARVESEDERIPPPLPVLATPVPDRVPLDDVTTEVSTEAVLAGRIPVRETPVPYQKVSVPDPFESRKPLLVPTPPEKDEPEAGPPQVRKP